jgi:hypothetical protein
MLLHVSCSKINGLGDFPIEENDLYVSTNSLYWLRTKLQFRLTSLYEVAGKHCQHNWLFSLAQTETSARLCFGTGLFAAVIDGEFKIRHLWADCLDNVGSLTSHNPIGLHGLLRG